MKRLFLSVGALAALAVVHAMTPSAPAQATQPAVKVQPVEMQGRIVRTGTDQFVIQSRDNKEIVFTTNPQTKFLLKDKAVRFADLRVGGNINIAYVRDGDRYIANSVTLVEDTAPQPEGTLLEGEVVRVIGQDQVVVRSGGKEVIVYVDPKTTYLFEEKPGRFVDIRVGAPISVRYDVREQRNVARHIGGPIRRR